MPLGTPCAGDVRLEPSLLLVLWDTPEAPLGVWGHPLAHSAKGTLSGSPPGTSVSAGGDILGPPPGVPPFQRVSFPRGQDWGDPFSWDCMVGLVQHETLFRDVLSPGRHTPWVGCALVRALETRAVRMCAVIPCLSPCPSPSPRFSLPLGICCW